MRDFSRSRFRRHSLGARSTACASAISPSVAIIAPLPNLNHHIRHPLNHVPRQAAEDDGEGEKPDHGASHTSRVAIATANAIMPTSDQVPLSRGVITAPPKLFSPSVHFPLPL